MTLQIVGVGFDQPGDQIVPLKIQSGPGPFSEISLMTPLSFQTALEHLIIGDQPGIF
jgi:hypothetical protein